jgi:hypothetical protein
MPEEFGAVEKGNTRDLRNFFVLLRIRLLGIIAFAIPVRTFGLFRVNTSPGHHVGGSIPPLTGLFTSRSKAED